jgi:prolyl-tRNA editing enzyme YbaK/EbsC (Cys-tRNA(Pro) deacylase)
VRAALDVHRDLLARGMPHEVIRLRTRAASADDLPRLLEVPSGCASVRCYVVERAGGTSFAALLVPAGAVPDDAVVCRALLAVAVAPATDEQVNASTGFAAGLVSPVGLPEDVEVLVDAALTEHDVVYCALGESGVALGIRTLDLLVASAARTVPLTGRAAVAPGHRDLPLQASPQASLQASLQSAAEVPTTR